MAAGDARLVIPYLNAIVLSVPELTVNAGKKP
jgi:hypothetical protein